MNGMGGSMALTVGDEWDHYSDCHAFRGFNGVIGVEDRRDRRLELVLAVVGDDRLGHHSTLGFIWTRGCDITNIFREILLYWTFFSEYRCKRQQYLRSATF